MSDINLSGKVETYYGEYSIEYWLKMLLNGEIVLPPYQRAFVWTPKQALGLVHSLKHGYFIPPVTIAYGNNEFPVKNKDNKQNLLLDGQQRLTSLLMLYLGLWFNEEDKTQIEEEKGLERAESESEDDKEYEKVIVYNLQSFSSIQKEYLSCKDIDELKNRLAEHHSFSKIEEKLESTEKERYSSLKNKIQEIFSECFLGYSYMRLDSAIDESSEKKFYSEIFRSINMKGVSLTIKENRSALYWLAPDKKNFLEPEFVNNYTVGGEPYDFVRCLAFVADYAKSQQFGTVAKRYAIGGRNPYTKYFDEYVLYIVGENSSETRFSPCPENWGDCIKQLEDIFINTLGESYKFKNISDADYAFFGLTYWVLCQGKTLSQNGDTQQKLRELLQQDTIDYKLQLNDREQDLYKDNPNVLGRIRKRLEYAINGTRQYFSTQRGKNDRYDKNWPAMLKKRY